MSNILAYPAIPEVSEADLLIISDISEDGNPTRTVSVQALVGGSTAPLGLTVNGTSGAATLIDNILNIPIYTGGGGGTVTNVTYSTNINAFAAGVTNSSSSPDITLTLNGGNVGQFLRQDGEWATVPVSSGVTQIIGGTNVTVSPVGGTGTVTVNSTDQFIGTVTGVTGTLPITSSGGTTPAIGINNYTGADGTTAGTNGAVPAPAATDNVKFLKGDGTWAVPAGGGGTMSQWFVDDGGGGGFPVTNNNNVIVGGTPKILVSTNTAAKSITWTHTDTARTDTTSTAAPAAGATFTVVDSITQDATGHPTAVNVKTVTMPASGGAGTTYDLASAQDGSNVDITLTPSTGAVDTVQLTAGSGITLTDNGSNNITIDAAAGGSGLWTATGNDIYNNNSNAVVIGKTTAATDTTAALEVSGRVSQVGLASNSTFFGFEAGVNVTGTSNVAFGKGCLSSAGVSGLSNTAVGTVALETLTTGYSNTAVGATTLTDCTTGHSNTAVGQNALNSLISGTYNTAVGTTSMGSADAGDFNTAIGYSTLITNTTGDTNIAVGRSSLSGNKAGNENIGLGAAALFYNQNGSGNIAIGEHAGSFLIASPPPSNENPTNSMYIGNQTKAYAANPTNEIVIGHEARGNGSNTTSIGRTGITTDTYLAGELHPYSAIHLPNGGAIASLPALFPNPSTGMRVYIINGPSSAGYRDIVSSASTGTQKLPIFYDGNNWIYA